LMGGQLIVKPRVFDELHTTQEGLVDHLLARADIATSVSWSGGRRESHRGSSGGVDARHHHGRNVHSGSVVVLGKGSVQFVIVSWGSSIMVRKHHGLRSWDEGRGVDGSPQLRGDEAGNFEPVAFVVAHVRDKGSGLLVGLLRGIHAGNGNWGNLDGKRRRDHDLGHGSFGGLDVAFESESILFICRGGCRGHKEGLISCVIDQFFLLFVSNAADVISFAVVQHVHPAHLKPLGHLGIEFGLLNSAVTQGDVVTRSFVLVVAWGGWDKLMRGGGLLRGYAGRQHRAPC
jgi:hypothetical protein